MQIDFSFGINEHLKTYPKAFVQSDSTDVCQSRCSRLSNIDFNVLSAERDPEHSGNSKGDTEGLRSKVDKHFQLWASYRLYEHEWTKNVPGSPMSTGTQAKSQTTGRAVMGLFI